MAFLGGVIRRTPVSSLARQELCSCKFWPAWTGIKAGTSVVAATELTNMLIQWRMWKESERERHDSCVCDCSLWQLRKGIPKSISFCNLEAMNEIEGIASKHQTWFLFLQAIMGKVRISSDIITVMREMTYSGVQSEHEHVLHAKYCQERNMAILGGMICRTPVLNPVSNLPALVVARLTLLAICCWGLMP